MKIVTELGLVLAGSFQGVWHVGSYETRHADQEFIRKAGTEPDTPENIKLYEHAMRQLKHAA